MLLFAWPLTGPLYHDIGGGCNTYPWVVFSSQRVCPSSRFRIPNHMAERVKIIFILLLLSFYIGRSLVLR